MTGGIDRAGGVQSTMASSVTTMPSAKPISALATCPAAMAALERFSGDIGCPVQRRRGNAPPTVVRRCWTVMV
jgi:hypothetical protein